MIPYEELVEALDRYVARNGGTPQSARVPASAAPMAPPPARAAVPTPAPVAAPSEYEPPTHEVHLPSGAFDEPHDPDLAPLGGSGQHDEGDAPHVGSMPGGAMPPPLQPVHEDHSNEIDIHDVLDDDEI